MNSEQVNTLQSYLDPIGVTIKKQEQMQPANKHR